MAGGDARAREGGVVRLKLCTVIVSYNRLPLLKETVFSYLATVTMPFSLVVVDNGSDEETRRWLKNSNLRVIYLGRTTIRATPPIVVGSRRSRTTPSFCTARTTTFASETAGRRP